MNPHPLAELRCYDAKAISRYYQRRPWEAIWRTIVILWLFAGFIIGLKWDEWFNQVERNKIQRATQLRETLTHLGPTFIKVGQALSTRPDLIRKDFLEELVKLQDQLPPFDNTIAFRILESDLNSTPDELFRDLSPTPIAAASLAQVYRARLHSGEEVAVKIQRPNLVPILTLDLYLIRWAATRIGRFLPLNLGHDLTLIVDEFGTKLFEEIDYLNEGHNAEKFAHNFRNNPRVKVPEIYWRYCSKRVLVLEWINGYKLTESINLERAGIDPQSIIEVGVTSGLQQLLEHGFFHADPHPGNLFATKDNQMAYIDFGMMDQLDAWMKETLVDALVHLINKDYKDLAQAFIKLGFLAPETDITPIIPALEDVLGEILGKSVGEFNLKTVTDRFSELMYEYPFRVPAKFALIIRSVVTQEGLALSLNPNFKIVDIGYPYLARRLLQGESPQLRRRLLEVLFKGGKFQWHRLENLIQIAQTDGNFDILPTAQLGLQYLFSEEGQFLRHQLLLALTEDDRLHAEEVQRLWNLVKEDVKPERLWDAAVEAIVDLSSRRASEMAAGWFPTAAFSSFQP
ncbi:MAG: AarF/ABC1/UbiB kinase family protein [Cyanobacteria bacterium SID2]|nr:AarF/ABC1/UbiB kinase family protein [Cyanobacteria bacterium SID2]MBP0006111.1 AarF/ABC1/UbiB kinase family protein [Cyanobacteria bacterium SBC]